MAYQGTSYVSHEMKTNFQGAGIKLREELVEKSVEIATLERYNAPLRAAFEKIRMDVDNSISKTELLRMEVLPTNCAVGLEGLCPIFLVFGAIPRPARITKSPYKLERAQEIESSVVEVER